MHLITSLLTLTAIATQVSGHGLVKSPAARVPGDAAAAVCGQTMVNFYKADNTSYPEALIRAGGTKDPKYNPKLCNLWLCRGYQFQDNADHVFEYKPGDKVPIEVFIRVPHLGYANVSVVDTMKNEVVGEPLKAWKEYADPAKFPNLPEDQVKFSVTVPDLMGKCAKPGRCVIQWYWLGAKQTYESCIDFTQMAPEAPKIRGRS
ncbi:conserved hypothetical protein [Histoplasma capsulatum G186AR]|uniref:Chitin-binding type-4 domain-containing protein n=1 Tax=Ajellomyces capsulatus (strain G186AR / H82 / ATCC MYA-2454 / RMSCC 2432) TaxID=447093 RepID=C0NLH2_AJECG|nr:uncharacterized protein HCBG_04352 [Histoplasma capsulatum G186AR]EEH07473.1 conserved hypothetical protein [Histoplasma capsulatum G186AR]